MIAKYKRRSNIAAVVFLIALVLLFSGLGSMKSTENIWESGNIFAQFAFLVMGISLILCPVGICKG
jgi:hypothetical protein